MKPKQRAIAALELKQPDVVPTFELEFQLTREYFNQSYHSPEDWKKASTAKEKERLIEDNARLYLKVAEYFDYSIIVDAHAFYPSIDNRLMSIKKLKELAGDNYLVFANYDGTYSIPDGEDMLEFSYSFFDKRDEMLAQAEKKVADAIEKGKRFADAGADGFTLCCDYCLNTGPFLSPAMFGEFVTPFLAKLVGAYRDMGKYVIKHTDGNIMPIIDQLVSCKPHALHSLDPQAKVDIKEVKKLYGNKICLVGNVMCSLLQTGTKEEILASARYAMENGKPGGGYIFSTSNVVFNGMPKESYDLMMDYYRKNRSY